MRQPTRNRNTPLSVAAISLVVSACAPEGASAPESAEPDATSTTTMIASSRREALGEWAELGGWIRSAPLASGVAEGDVRLHVTASGRASPTGDIGSIKIGDGTSGLRFESDRFVDFDLQGFTAVFEAWGAVEGWGGPVRAVVVASDPSGESRTGPKALVRVQLYAADGTLLYDNRPGHYLRDVVGAELESGRLRLGYNVW